MALNHAGRTERIYIMQYFALFVKLIPLIIQLVSLAEKFFVEKGSGADKKAAVIEAVKATYDGVQGISTGGQKETLDAIDPLVDKMVDFAAGLLFPSGSEH
jgi:hypothetical protein